MAGPSFEDMNTNQRVSSILKEIKAEACKINGLLSMLAHLEEYFVDEDIEKIKRIEQNKGPTLAWDELIDVLKRSDFKAFYSYVKKIFTPDEFPCPDEFRSKLQLTCRKYGLGYIRLNYSFGSFETSTERPLSSMEVNECFRAGKDFYRQPSNQSGAKEKRHTFSSSSIGSNESRSNKISTESFGSTTSFDEPAQPLNVDSYLKSLPQKVRRKLCNALDRKTIIGQNWSAFADYLGLDQTSVQELEEKDEKMKEILNFMQQKMKRIKDLVTILSHIERIDCICILSEGGVQGLPHYEVNLTSQLSQPEQEQEEETKMLAGADQEQCCTQESEKIGAPEDSPVSRNLVRREVDLSISKKSSPGYHSCKKEISHSSGRSTVEGQSLDGALESEQVFQKYSFDEMPKYAKATEKGEPVQSEKYLDQEEGSCPSRKLGNNTLRHQAGVQESEEAMPKDYSKDCFCEDLKSPEKHSDVKGECNAENGFLSFPGGSSGKTTSCVLTPFLMTEDCESESCLLREVSKLQLSDQEATPRGSVNVDASDGASSEASFRWEEEAPRNGSRNKNRRWIESDAFRKEYTLESINMSGKLKASPIPLQETYATQAEEDGGFVSYLYSWITKAFEGFGLGRRPYFEPGKKSNKKERKQKVSFERTLPCENCESDEEEVLEAGSSAKTDQNSATAMHDAIVQNEACPISARNALIIGIHDYQNLPKLPAENFTVDLQSSLEDNGWSVERWQNLPRRDFVNKVGSFTQQSKGKFAFLFYFGHSVQIHGENYLLPVDVQLQHVKSKGNLKKHAVSLSSILSMVAVSEASCVVLDAGRNLPSVALKKGVAGIEPTQNHCVLSSAFSGTEHSFLAKLMADRLNGSDEILSVGDLIKPFKNEVDVFALSRRLLPMPFKVPGLSEGHEPKFLDLSSAYLGKYAFKFEPADLQDTVALQNDWLAHHVEDEKNLELEFLSFLKTVNDDSLKLCLFYYQGGVFLEDGQLFFETKHETRTENPVSLSWILDSMSENILGPRVVVIDAIGCKFNPASLDLDHLNLQEVLLVISSASMDSETRRAFRRQLSRIISENDFCGSSLTGLGSKYHSKVIRNSLFDIGI